MQTLKTAAIVVLLMTVMYGAYVSLTTPPEPLPGDVEDMLIASEEDALAIDVGLPASLGEMDFNQPVTFPDQSGDVAANVPATSSQASNSQFPPPGDYSPSDVIEEAPLTGFPSDYEQLAGSNPPVTASFSDAMPSDLSGAEFGAASDLSAPIAQPLSSSATTASPASRDYPVTANTFELPDPNSVDDIQARRNLSNEDPNALALTSGTTPSESPSFGAANSLPPASSELAPTTPPSNIQLSAGLANAIRIADTQYADDKRKEALATLSLFYNTPTMTSEERSALLARLDPLAREVIYSTRHLLEQPYRVGQGETLMDVATRYEVPWQLLANINQIEDPVTILPGTELKVVRGPFRADVHLTRKELTLFLGDMYAGRFPIGIGNDPVPKPGTFTVQEKRTSRTFYDAAGTPIPPGSRDNPYGNVWLDLGGQLSIHGSPSTTKPTDKGCISLAGDFAEDLYGILSQGSSVTIRR